MSRHRIRLSDDNPPVTLSDVAEDALVGADAVCLFLWGQTGLPYRKRLYHLVKTNKLPVGHQGGRILGSKQTLREHHRKTSGGAS
jgi:hypothetical protein